MSNPTAFHALAKLPQTAESLEQINTLQAEHEQLESRLDIVQDARSLSESYPVDIPLTTAERTTRWAAASGRQAAR